MATITARTIIKKAMKELGVIGVGQAVNAEMEDDAFLALNNMLEKWSNERLMVQEIVEEAETLTSGQASYTVGSGGNFDTNRPVAIEKDAFIRDSGGNDHPVQVLTMDVYRAETVKTTSGRPDYLAYTPEFPLGKMYLYPTPDNSTDVLHYRAVPLLDSFATVTTSVEYAPGYEDAIILNLAVRIAPSWGKQPSPLLVTMAMEAKRSIKNRNSEPVQPVKFGELAALTGSRRTGTFEEGPFR